MRFRIYWLVFVTVSIVCVYNVCIDFRQNCSPPNAGPEVSRVPSVLLDGKLLACFVHLNSSVRIYCLTTMASLYKKCDKNGTRFQAQCKACAINIKTKAIKRQFK